MKLSLRIPLTLTNILVVTGIIAFIMITMKTGAFPTVPFIIGLVGSLILIEIRIGHGCGTKRMTHTD
jgi:hypothetical protein